MHVVPASVPAASAPSPADHESSNSSGAGHEARTRDLKLGKANPEGTGADFADGNDGFRSAADATGSHSLSQSGPLCHSIAAIDVRPTRMVLARLKLALAVLPHPSEGRNFVLEAVRILEVEHAVEAEAEVG